MKRLINLNSVRAHIGSQAASTVVRLQTVSKSKRLAYYSAAAVAFIIAPIAALTLSAKANTNVNLETTDTNTGSSSTESSSADSLIQAALESSISQGNSSSSDDSKVESNVETSLSVNGEDVDVPDNGSLNEVITNQDGSVTHVVVNSNSTSTSSDEDQSTNSKVKVKSSTSVRTYTRSSQ